MRAALRAVGTRPSVKNAVCAGSARQCSRPSVAARVTASLTRADSSSMTGKNLTFGSRPNAHDYQIHQHAHRDHR